MRSKHGYSEDIVSAASFKSRCLQIMDDVAQSHHSITVTKHGRPVVIVSPAVEPESRLFGSLKGLAHVKGDIISPTREEWEAEAQGV